MILLAVGVAILDEHTQLTRFETSASISAALGTAGIDLVHPSIMPPVVVVNLEDLESTSGANQEYWLLAIRMAREDSRLRCIQQTTHRNLTNTYLVRSTKFFIYIPLHSGAD
jgi:hypothetical protein